MKIWIFGHSFSLPYKVDFGWPDHVKKYFDCEVVNLAKAAVDNFYIYNSYLEVQNQIAKEDVVIIGWSHPSRKLFILDNNNIHQTGIVDKSFYYKSQTKEFIRSTGVSAASAKKLSLMHPKDGPLSYYNDWFNKYYSKPEQSLNFQAYYDSVLLTNTSRYVPFFFSKDSISDINIRNYTGLCMLDYIIDNKLELSKTDGHANTQGHSEWANILIKIIETNNVS